MLHADFAACFASAGALGCAYDHEADVTTYADGRTHFPMPYNNTEYWGASPTWSVKYRNR